MSDQPQQQQPSISHTDPPQIVNPQSPEQRQEAVQQQQQPQQQQQQPQQTQQPQHNGADVLDAVNALPEKMVAAIREAFPAPQQQQSPPQQQQTQQTQQQTQQTQQQNATREPGRKRFVEWWFGL